MARLASDNPVYHVLCRGERSEIPEFRIRGRGEADGEAIEKIADLGSAPDTAESRSQDLLAGAVLN